jgi:hypothetical protein
MGEWKAASPITYAGNLNLLSLIIQGSTDSRTPVELIRVFENEVYWFEAGCMVPTTKQWIEFTQPLLDFANAYFS